ncbi:3-dehydroquinate dehydratase (3-dehydroquinase) [Blyttiomyces sp. JEL0837]|nr:3-dehydroquinate dehydratase (3-dehydroquinase) [Blyttiomyces sp. JEL0837]
MGPQKISILGQETITVGHDMTNHIAASIVETVPASTYVITTDTNIAPLHLAGLEGALKAALTKRNLKSRILVYVIPPGESVKTREVKALAEDWMLANKCTRDSCIVALGGGVIGDMFGFVAATFMRGIPFIQIPTTLLAMVDSSIGGKTAVDTPHGKNLVGSFHQPRHIFIDLQYLRTLPHREFVNGLAEVIKTAAIWDEQDFSLLENHSDEILALSAQGSTNKDSKPDPTLLLKVVLGSVRVKAHVVTVDEKETGLRGLLNFGHSIGHAIEAILAPDLLHGECVSMGMVREAEIARHLGYITDVDVGRLVRCLQAYGLPISTEDKRVKQLAPNKHCPVDKLLDVMRIDKKNQGDRKRIVMLAGIGKTYEPKASFIEDTIIRKILSPAVEVVPISTASGQPKFQEVRLNVPGSKSISNRALVLAALGSGTCRLKGLLHSDDVQVMLDALHKLVGITYTWEDNGDTLIVVGGSGKLRVPSSEIYLGNAGTAARFLTTVCALVPKEGSAVDAGHTIVTGNARMKQRPIAHLVEALRSNDCQIEYMESHGCLPLRITPQASGLKGGLIRLSAAISSQYVSSILLSAPYAATPVTLELIGDAVVSQPYIDMTIAMMESFGIKVTREPGTNLYHIPKGVYVNPSAYEIEADASSATYPLAFAAITGAKVTVGNIGSRSLQGDAEFAVKVLKTMGCSVQQTATETTVQGPKVLRPIPSIDMESMTDAFLTASVLAAVAVGDKGSDNITRITGIANQRVKECNRIAAMVEQLAKFGVVAKELPDGIEIHGIGENPSSRLIAPNGGVKCYDDHRIAMSFSILACVLGSGKRAVINEKKCVEKTWPSWWDTYERKLGVQVLGVDLAPTTSSSEGRLTSSPKKRAPSENAAGPKKRKLWEILLTPGTSDHAAENDATIVFIGMRGAGKSSMGQAAAMGLNRQFVDMDKYFETQVGITIIEYLKTHSWEQFREVEANQLVKVLLEHPRGYVVSCGGGIVETPRGRDQLKTWCGKAQGKAKGHVVHITRDIKDIAYYLSLDQTRPVYKEDTVGVWNKRKPFYDECSSAEFTIYKDSEVKSWGAVENDLLRLLRFLISGASSSTVTTVASPADKILSDSSFFLSLTFSDLREAVSILDKVSEGSDALELRVDLLKSQSSEYVSEQISILRRYSSLPIIFTVRTVGQGGRFPDDQVTAMFDLLHLGVKCGCEFVDVEVLEVENRKNLLDKLVANKGHSHLIASYHDVSGTALWEDVGYGSGLSGSDPKAYQQLVRMKEKYIELHRYSDSIKLIGRANSLEDNFALHRFTSKIVPGLNLSPSKPLIALNMGPLGQISRALNTYLTPVTHPGLPMIAAPGQLSVAEIFKFRAMLGLVKARNFYLFGSPISKSMSPTLHNTGFELLGLPYKYNLSESNDINHVMSIVEKGIASGSFGGASVTIPHKESVMKVGLLSSVTDAAAKIGAVNTLTVSYDGPSGPSVTGDNTDWLGIRTSILQRLEAWRAETSSATPNGPVLGVVIGAGGTARAACYALNSLGVDELRVWNRTLEKAKSLAEAFNGLAVADPSVDTLLSAGRLGPAGCVLVISTIPGEAQKGINFQRMLEKAATLTGSFGVVVELAYRPRETPILQTVRANTSWATVEGIEILIEQGFEQFQRWTGRKAPASAMMKAVYDQY